MGSRFHNKFHRQSHHTNATAGNPDSASDPIASPTQPFQGDFVVNGALSASTFSANVLSATELHAVSAFIHYQDLLISELSGFVVLGAETSLDVPLSVEPGVNNVTLDGIGLSGNRWASFNGDLKVGQNITASGGTSIEWNSTYTTVNSNSANWSGTSTTVNSNSANWDSTFTTVGSNSANWSGTSTTVNSNSANWSGTSTTVNSNSANWSSIKRTNVIIEAGAGYRNLTVDESSTTFVVSAQDDTSMQFNLPSVGVSDLGTYYSFVKFASGTQLIISALDAQIDDSDVNATIYSGTSALGLSAGEQDFASIEIELVLPTQWHTRNGRKIWTTTQFI